MTRLKFNSCVNDDMPQPDRVQSPPLLLNPSGLASNAEATFPGRDCVRSIAIGLPGFEPGELTGTFAFNDWSSPLMPLAFVLVSGKGWLIEFRVSILLDQEEAIGEFSEFLDPSSKLWRCLDGSYPYGLRTRGEYDTVLE